MSNGVVIFSRNNEIINYAEIACICAGLVRKNLSGFDEIALITDTKTYESYSANIDHFFDRVIIVDNTEVTSTRLFKDTAAVSIPAAFNNTDRGSLCELSPYDETLVIDSDYMVMSNALDKVWGSKNDFMINRKFIDVSGTFNSNVMYVDDFSIPLSWATVFYFRKSDFSKTLFDLVEHIKNNYKYYATLYNFSPNLFRNDYVFSLALHILNGGVAHDTPDLPIPYLMHSFSTDDIYQIKSANEIILYTTKKDNYNEFVLAKFKDVDVHVMNKAAILRHADEAKKIIGGFV